MEQPEPELTEENQTNKILNLLEATYLSKDTKEIKEAENELDILSKKLNNFNDILYKCLLINSINGKKITLNLHKSVLLYLRTMIMKKSGELSLQEIYECIKNIIKLIFSWEQNPNLNNGSLMLLIQYIINFLLNLSVAKDNDELVYNLLNEILKFSNKKYNNDDEILIGLGKVLFLYITVITSKSCNGKNFEYILMKYFYLIADKILEYGKNYINIEMNIYNAKYVLIIKDLFDSFYKLLNHYKQLLDIDKYKEICFAILKKYYKYINDLIQFCPKLDTEAVEKYQKQNPILVFSHQMKKYSEINLMKSRVIQLISYIVQNICNVYNEYDLSKGHYNNSKNEKNINKIYNLNDEDLNTFIINIIKLIVKCFEDLLSNKNKYLVARNYENEIFKEENSVTILLYELCVFLTRVLVRQPFKNLFKNDIKLFLLNILLPLFATNETEKNSIENDFDMYHVYFNDITDDFKTKTFRTSGLFLIVKICQHFSDESNFLLSFMIEMFNFIINDGNVIKNGINYNVYVENRNKFIVDELDIETKIDLFLLLIIILKEKIYQNNLIKSRLRNILLDNQLKLHQIQPLCIKIKLCKLYSLYIPTIFQDDQILSKNDPLLSCQNDNDNENKIIENNPSNDKYKIFIHNAIDYILQNIAQNYKEKNNNNNMIYINSKNYFQALSCIAVESLTNLITSFREKYDEELEESLPEIKFAEINTYLNDALSSSFKFIIELILFFDNYAFFNLIDYIMENIQTKDRNDIFICLEKITEKFVDEMSNIKMDDQNDKEYSPFITQYFKILSSFLRGKNKLNKENMTEVDYFEKILDKIFEIVDISNLEFFDFNEEFIGTIDDYINCCEFINQKSIQILRKLSQIIEKDNILSLTIYSFLLTFIKYLSKTFTIDKNSRQILLKEIYDIIILGYNYEDDMCNQSRINCLLLTLEFFNHFINEIPLNIYRSLIITLLNSIATFDKASIDENELEEKAIINQLCLCNISFGFIFRTSETYQLIFEDSGNKLLQNEIKDENDNTTNDKNKPERKSKNLGLYITLLISGLGLSKTEYTIILYKTIILGVCSIFKDNYCINKINQDHNIRFLFLQYLVQSIDKQKKEQVIKANKMMKKEIKMNFNDDENYEDDDDDYEESEEFEDELNARNEVKDILEENDMIKNTDEYKIFSEIFSPIRNNEPEVYKELKNYFRGNLDDLLLFRNINVNYNGQDINVPRKRVKMIIRKNK